MRGKKSFIYLSQEYAANSLYALLNYSYKDMIFVDATNRIDWASTLASPKRNEVKPFIYPSLNTSFVMSQLLNLPKAINFWKIRASIAQVGVGDTSLSKLLWLPVWKEPLGALGIQLRFQMKT
jgi:hypothetical protein